MQGWNLRWNVASVCSASETPEVSLQNVLLKNLKGGGRMSRRLLISRMAAALGLFLGVSAGGQDSDANSFEADLDFLKGVMADIQALWLRKPSDRDMIAGFYAGLSRELGAKYRKYFARAIPADFDMAVDIYLGAIVEISKNAPKDAQGFAVRVLLERSVNAYLGNEDEYAAFIPRTISQVVLTEKVSKGYVGIGVDLKKGPDGPICFPISGAQAALEGVRKGDVLLEIDKREARYMTIYEASERLRGKPESKVKIRVRHGESGAEEEELTIDRARIESAPLEIRSTDTAHHFRLTKIVPAAVEAMKTGLMSIGPGKGIVIDLRGNPGGDYGDSVKVAELFLPKGVAISKIQKLSGEERKVSENAAPYVPSKLSIFQDGNTASGAELIIAALTAHKPLRVRTFGTKTFGKGVTQVQVSIKAGKDGMLVLTDAKMYGPNNEDWDGKGLESDEELPAGIAR